ncbi:hypothetical protein EGR_06310 [Echinococcus granulosus]|uniref:Uncharacterized protein n=1 Tax=Echinococcus granulosus TaxID=6210 RepID=W6UDI7_ECHGR|nr:hypothetical protein EGR_06310 [Echinococcus granulosus]EUB58886.1 hypothetical protein EGR_06310 [Echinococcus granulosus]
MHTCGRAPPLRYKGWHSSRVHIDSTHHATSTLANPEWRLASPASISEPFRLPIFHQHCNCMEVAKRSNKNNKVKAGRVRRQYEQLNLEERVEKWLKCLIDFCNSQLPTYLDLRSGLLTMIKMPPYVTTHEEGDSNQVYSVCQLDDGNKGEARNLDWMFGGEVCANVAKPFVIKMGLDRWWRHHNQLRLPCTSESAVSGVT